MFNYHVLKFGQIMEMHIVPIVNHIVHHRIHFAIYRYYIVSYIKVSFLFN